MQRSKKKIFARYVIYIIELLLVYTLEQILASRLGFCGLYMFLVIPVFVSISLFERENTGMLFGLLAGVLTDYGYGFGIGVYAIFFCIVGYFLGMISNYILRANILTEILISTFLILIVYSFGTFFAVWDLSLFASIWKENFWKDLLASVSAFVPAFYFNRVISYKFGGDEEIVD
ncbi:MAG: rod shape-determining protein MreD [Clostridia bacterium]|nr:rod shape-determining protein MreD [Clostridia bacterium]